MSEENHDFANPLRRALQAARRPLIGIWSMLNSPAVSEGLALCGYDWVVIDGEHAPIELPDVIRHMQILDRSPTLPIVRLALNDPLLIKRHLDAGVRSLMLPFVESAEEAESAVREMHYPPKGRRGLALGQRASGYGLWPDYPAHASESLFLICQIETGAGLEALEAIMATEGVDAAFFGPSDLSASLGLPGGAAGEAVTELILSAREKVARSGRFAGAFAASEAQAERFIAAGFDFVAVAVDVAILMQGAAQIARRHAGPGG